jgi:hypothetical protein
VALDLVDRYFVKESDVIVWLPPSSIANTSKPCSPGSSDATNSGGTVTLIDEGGSVAGRVTSKDPTITWYAATTIIPRGQALGVTLATPESDRYRYRRDDLLAKIKVALERETLDQPEA